MRDKELLKLLLADGWEEVRVTGSHHRLRKGRQLETVPVHGREIATGTLQAILKRTGLKLK